MKRWLITALVLLLLGGTGGLLIVVLGLVPIRASAGHFAVTEWFLQLAKRRAVATQSSASSSARSDDSVHVLKGAGHFHTACRPCHGAPDLPRQPVTARGMLPPPPDLSARARHWDREELFFIVKHGLKFTGMPAWPTQQRDDEVGAMVAFLGVFADLDGPAYERLVLGEPRERAHPDAAAESIGDLVGPDGAVHALLASCTRCHGADGTGRGSAAFPKLAGQARDYFAASLAAYAAGARPSGLMQPVAAALDTEEMERLAAYYARRPAAGSRSSRPSSSQPPAAADTQADRAAIARGRQIAERGVPERKVPSCSDCHGPGEPSAGAPRLAAQYADYLLLQLELFAARTRGGSESAHLMDEVAPLMTHDQMRDAALYYASLPPTATASD